VTADVSDFEVDVNLGFIGAKAGGPGTGSGIHVAAEAAIVEAPLMGDAHGSAAYKGQLLKTALPRAIEAALRRSRSHA
jgi:CO/xanthine dehydrogenase FAD-binding subunit